MAINGGSVEITFEGNTTPLRRSVEEVADEISQVEKEAKRLESTLNDTVLDGLGSKAKKEFSTFSDAAGTAFSGLISEATRASSALSEIGVSLGKISLSTLTAGATAATGALTGLIAKGIQSADFLESARISMAGLTGSFEQGNKAMTEAAKFWQNNPFQRIDVTSATQQLVQFGRSTSDISSDLSMLGDVSLSTGMNIADLARYYARVSASGRAMTMDLEMMSDRGVPIYRELEKQLNTTTAGVREMASQGKIDFETFRKAMEGAVSSEAMEQYENTLARQTDRLKGSIQIIAGELAGYKIVNDELVISESGLEKAWTRLLKTVATGLRSDDMKTAFEGIGNALAKLVDKITTLVEPALNMLSKVLKFVGENGELLIPIFAGLSATLLKFGGNLPVIGGFVRGLNANFGELFDKVKKFVALNPVLTSMMVLFGTGLASAYKNSESFRNSISSIFSSLTTLAKNLMEAFRGVFDILGQIVSTLAGSGAIQGIIEGVASALAWVANALASIPPEMLASLISFFLTLKVLNVNPVYVAVAGIALLITKIKELGGVGEFLAKIPEQLATIGHNMMTGLVNGIQEGAKKVINYIKQLGQVMVSSLKNMLGIHSPSTVMYGIGQFVTLGLANGIEDSKSAVQIAMNNLAKDILSLSEKIIKNKVDFGILDVKGEYQQWKKVSKMFTQGSEQYNYAIQKMEDARKEANLQILKLQQEYNDALDTTINRIATMYGVFDSVNLKNTTNSSKILKNLDQQVAKMQEWADAQDIIANSNLDKGLIEELQSMGVESVGELSAVAAMTADELANFNSMWLQKQKIAAKSGTKIMEGMKNDTLDQIKDIKNGIDGITVDVEDVGGRLVSHISEGVYGAMPTLENAFSQLGSYIEKAQKDLAKSASGTGGDLGTSVDVPNAGEDVVKSLKDEIQNSMGKIKDMLPNILIGAAAAVGVFKLAPKIGKLLVGKFFNNTNIGKDITDTFSRLMSSGLKNAGSGGAMEKVAQEMAQGTKASSTIAQSSTVVGNNMQTAGKGLSKVNSVLNTIIKGAGAVIAIAAAIAAMAGALWLTYNALKDIDFGVLAGQLGLMAGTTAVFGTISGVIGKLDTKMLLKGILALGGIAVEIVVLAGALRLAYEAMKPISWGDFGEILGMMAVSLATFGALNGILGIKVVAIAEALGELVSVGIAAEIVVLSLAIREAYEAMKDITWDAFGQMLGQMAEALLVMGGLNVPLAALMPLTTIGWISILEICDEMIKVARALKEVDEKVPEDFGSLEQKLWNIKKTLEIINGLDLGTVIGMMVTSWSAGPVERIMDMYLHVAEVLNKLSTINLDKQAIEKNLDYIKSTLESIEAKSGVISGWLEASAMDMEASTVENAGRIVIVYGDMVDALDKLSNFTPDEEGITRSLTSMVGVITMLRNSSYGGGGLFTIFNDIGTVANDVEKIKSIVKDYLEMVPTMKDLGKSENEISDDLRGTVQKNIDNIKAIVLTIGSVDTGGWIDQKESDMDKIQSILNKFTELEPVIWQIAQFNLSYLEGDNSAKAKIGKIRDIVLEIGRVDTGGWIDQKESDMAKIQSILNKYTEVAKTCGLLSKYPIPDNAVSWIQTIRNIVWEIGQINQSESGSLDAKAEIIEKSKTIATKLGEFGQILNSLEGVNSGDVVNQLTGALNQLLDGVATSLTEKTAVFSNVGVNIGQKLAAGVKTQTGEMQVAGLTLQTSFWRAIEDRMDDEWHQGEWMATQFGNGLKSVNFDNVGAAMQTSLWWGIQNRMNDEYNQGRSMGGRFRQGLYDIDYGNAGWWAVQGFINGAWGKAGSGDGVYHTGWWIADRFLRGLKDRGGQGSPWKTTLESGNWAMEGLINGLREQEGALVSEATTIADEVIDALTMDNLTMSPSLDVSSNLAPTMGEGDYGIIGGSNREVTVNQEITAYTPYDIDTVSRDLQWQLSKI